MDRAFAKERSEQIAREWSAAMQAGKHGSVRDFVAVGDVDIKVIGADNQILDSEVPVRQIMEQLVAATGLPPFMLGFSWSTTERMSSQQADMITSEMTAIRRSLELSSGGSAICGSLLTASGEITASSGMTSISRMRRATPMPSCTEPGRVLQKSGGKIYRKGGMKLIKLKETMTGVAGRCHRRIWRP
jgi:hypothetical protein